MLAILKKFYEKGLVSRQPTRIQRKAPSFDIRQNGMANLAVLL